MTSLAQPATSLPAQDPRGARVHVFAPTGRDGQLTCEILHQAGYTALSFATPAELCAEITTGAEASILAEEALTPEALACLVEFLERQAPWSDLPLIVFTRSGDAIEEILVKLGRSGNVTVLERPVRISTLLSAVNSAVRARRRQYDTRDLLMRLEETGRRKDEFLAMLGHELRNPLSAIRNALHVLERVDPNHPAADRQMGVLDRQSRHLTRMVEDLLDVSRVTMGKVTLQLQRVDLCEIAERVCGALRPLAEEHRHRFECRLPKHPVLVEADPVRLEQILTNLLHNAIKYTPPGGMIATELSCTRDEAVVRVRDNGTGISQEMLAGIFDLFTQAEVSLARSEGGLGLGLTLVKNLVEMHHGTVCAESEGLGKGSVFEVRFPLLRSEDRQSEGEPANSQSAPRLHRHILLVEDNDDGRETLKELLELWGHRVDVACDGVEGLEQARTLHPEVMLVDIGLPRMDGFEVARRILAEFHGDRPALIAMTGYGQPTDCDKALEAGFDVFLVKPVDPIELAQQVASVTTEHE